MVADRSCSPPQVAATFGVCFMLLLDHIAAMHRMLTAAKDVIPTRCPFLVRQPKLDVVREHNFLPLSAMQQSRDLIEEDWIEVHPVWRNGRSAQAKATSSAWHAGCVPNVQSVYLRVCFCSLYIPYTETVLDDIGHVLTLRPMGLKEETGLGDGSTTCLRDSATTSNPTTRYALAAGNEEVASVRCRPP